nr:hypothetical protein [Anaerolineae bacterium]
MSNYSSDLPPNERPSEHITGLDNARDEPVPHSRHSAMQSEQRDTLNVIFIASLLLMAGVVFLASNFDLLPAFNNAEPWEWIVLGAGGLMVLFAIVRAISPDHAGPNLFGIIIGLVLLGFGAGAVFGVDISLTQWWPVILIILGLSAMARAIGNRR